MPKQQSMSTEKKKEIAELEIFSRFIQKSSFSVIPRSVKHGRHLQKEPDILCSLESGQSLAFELTRSIAPEFAIALKKNENFTWGADVIEATVRKKLCKEYHVDCPVDLLIYTDARTGSNDDNIIAKIQPILQCRGLGPFRKVWLFGDGVHEIATD
jgi:hypothetical protein